MRTAWVLVILASSVFAQESRGFVSKLAPLVADARKEARGQNPDAALVGIFVKAGPDGRVDLARLVTPANLNGGFVSMQFHSAAAGLIFVYTLEASGRAGVAGPGMPAGTETVPIPDKFLDFDQAMTKARELGFKPPRADAGGFVDARLVGVRSEPGRAGAATWTITGLETSGGFPAPTGEPVVIDASSGQKTTEDELSGRLDRRMLAEELTRGKTFPNAQRDFAFYRKEADAWAPRWNPQMKLGGLEASGRESAAGFALDRAVFHYFAPAEGGFNTMVVEVFSTREGMLFRAGDLGKEMTTAAPRAVPEKFLAPETAAARLHALDSGVGTDPASLALVFGGNLAHQAAKSGRTPDAETARVLAVIKDRWLWVAQAEKSAREREGIFVWDRRYAVTVAIDAVTGEPLVKDADAVGGNRSGPVPVTKDDLDTVPKLVELLASEDPSHRELGAYRLGVKAVEDREAVAAAVPALVETLGDRFPVTRQNAAIALGNVGPGAKDAVPALINLLHDRDKRPREAAAKALGQIAAAPETAVLALAVALGDVDGGVRAASAVSLGQFGEAAAPAAGPLGTALTDPSAGVHMAAAEALAKIGPKGVAGATGLAAVLRRRNEALQEAAARGLAAMGPAAREAVPTLAAAVSDGNANVANAAAAALGAIGSEARGAVPALVEALARSAVAAKAAEALCRIPEAGPTALPAIAAMLDKNAGDPNQSFARGEVLKALGLLGSAGGPVVPALVKVLRDDREHTENRKAAAESLQKIGPAAQDAVAALAEHVKDKRATPESRSDAAKVLGSIGAAAAPAVPALTQVVGDASERDDVRLDADQARKKIMNGK